MDKVRSSIAGLRALLVLAALAALAQGCGDGAVDGVSTRAAFLQASQVSAGDLHTCALANGTVKCWGEGGSGQLGGGSTTDALSPEAATGITTATQISAGGSHTCALLADGTIRCWGANSNGQLGTGNTDSSSVPVAAAGVTDATLISAGGSHTCALLSDGTIRCWGRNISGQLGNGGTASSSSPVTVTGISTATAVSAGESHTCALLSDSTVRCWGSNSLEQIGDAELVAGSRAAEPAVVDGLVNVASLDAGSSHNCAVLTTGSVRCWGDNSSGQLGATWTIISTVPLLALTASSTPLSVTSITAAASLSAGLAHTCAISDGRVLCWGENASGQLGGGSTVGFIPPGPGTAGTSTIVPVAASGVSTADAVSAGLLHTCAKLTGNRVLCWGEGGSGQLGDGSGLASAIPVQVLN